MILWSTVSGSLTRKQNTNTQFLSVLLGIFEMTFSNPDFSLFWLAGQRAWWWLGRLSVMYAAYLVTHHLPPTTYHPPSLLVCCHNIIGWSCLKTNASSFSSNWCQWSLQNFSQLKEFSLKKKLSVSFFPFWGCKLIANTGCIEREKMPIFPAPWPSDQ